MERSLHLDIWYFSSYIHLWMLEKQSKMFVDFCKTVFSKDIKQKQLHLHDSDHEFALPVAF